MSRRKRETVLYARLPIFPHFSPTCFDKLSWNFVCHFLLIHSIKFECVQFASLVIGVMPLLELIILEIQSFPHFSPTCFDILSWNFAYSFVLLFYRSSRVSPICFVCPFWNLEYWKYTVFRNFHLHASTHWAEIAYSFVSLYYRSSSSVVNLRHFL